MPYDKSKAVNGVPETDVSKFALPIDAVEDSPF
jgi:hypothetical protein